MSPFFSVEGLSLRFGGVRAIRDLSFAVEPGEVFAIIGPNGAGKTSVFNAVTRIFDPDAGRIVMDGLDITHVPRHRVVSFGIARTFQNIELFEGATVLENLLLARHCSMKTGLFSELLYTRAVKRTEAKAREEVEKIIELLPLAAHRNSLVGGLPYGVRKVVELGRALAAEPRMLLLDEPASGLNPEETEELSFWIEDINQDLGVTILMIEHDMALVAQTAQRVLVMDQGQALMIGTYAEVQENPAVAAAYMGKRP